MNLNSLIPLLKPSPYISAHLQDFLNAVQSVIKYQFSHNLLENFIEARKLNLKYYELHSWYVDDEHVGTYVFSYDNKVFGSIQLACNNKVDYSITDLNTFKKVSEVLKECVLDPEPRVLEEYPYLTNLEHFPLVQSFESPYHVKGENLLYADKFGGLHHVQNYKQDGNVHTSWMNPEFLITVNNREMTISFRRLFSVITDSKEIADKLVSGEYTINSMMHYNIINNRGSRNVP